MRASHDNINETPRASKCNHHMTMARDTMTAARAKPNKTAGNRTSTPAHDTADTHATLTRAPHERPHRPRCKCSEAKSFVPFCPVCGPRDEIRDARFGAPPKRGTGAWSAATAEGAGRDAGRRKHKGSSPLHSPVGWVSGHGVRCVGRALSKRTRCSQRNGWCVTPC